MSSVPSNEQRLIGQQISAALAPFGADEKRAVLIAALWGLARERGITAQELAQEVFNRTSLLERGVADASNRIIETVPDSVVHELNRRHRLGRR